MKKEKIKINGIRYKYIINDSNQIEVEGIVSNDIINTNKERLIKKGKYQDKKSETIKIKYDEKYLERRFQKWANIELELYYDELQEKHKLGRLDSEEKLIVQPIREELERRGIKYDK